MMLQNYCVMHKLSADASEETFGTCAYFQWRRNASKVEARFIACLRAELQAT